MEHEIKFRAWHIAEGKMCDIELISFKMNGAFLIGVVPAPDQYSGRLLIESPKEGRFCDNAEFKLMQFTGLKDNNGVKIYEGDILKSLHFIDNNKEQQFLYHRVIWCERLTGWQAVSGKQTGEEIHGNPQLFVYVKNLIFEVVGNIYEHPNLINKNQAESI